MTALVVGCRVRIVSPASDSAYNGRTGTIVEHVGGWLVKLDAVGPGMRTLIEVHEAYLEVLEDGDRDTDQHNEADNAVGNGYSPRTRR